ncbi:MAG: hypothetical protein HKP58_03675 [Desulfatitalea sp.]|nr:hypothetical protein [Desulfatitalea sp.]
MGIYAICQARTDVGKAIRYFSSLAAYKGAGKKKPPILQAFAPVYGITCRDAYPGTGGYALYDDPDSAQPGAILSRTPRQIRGERNLKCDDR